MLNEFWQHLVLLYLCQLALAMTNLQKRHFLDFAFFLTLPIKKRQLFYCLPVLTLQINILNRSLSDFAYIRWRRSKFIVFGADTSAHK